jgi:4-diphosphocytidyl-2-C-methyl-D-erythritol kinase
VKGGAAQLTCGCKINLFLRIGGRLDSGYHELRSLMLPLAEPFDRITIDAADKEGGADLTVRFHPLAEPEKDLKDIDRKNNTLNRAYHWFKERTAFAPRLLVNVYKGIAHGAGLGGGSADAAVFLSFLHTQAVREGRLPEQDLSADEDFIRASAAIGADVPFFLLEAPAQVFGIGEKLLACPNPVVGFFLVLVCPAIFISTAWAFRALDLKRGGAEFPALPGREDAAALLRLGNDFEDVVYGHYPELGAIRDALLDYGAQAARLSGSGSAIFGIFPEENRARAASEDLARRGYSVYRQQLP